MLRKLLVAAALCVAGAAMASADDVSANEWDQTVAQAREEGRVNWFVWYLRDDLRRFVQPFEKKYGIAVTIPEGTADANAQKLLSERDREPGDIDVFTYGLNNFESLDITALFLPLDFLPEDEGRLASVSGEDGKSYILSFWGNQTGIAYDTSVLAQADLPQTAEDFARFWTEHPGKFGFNYENGGSGPSFYLNLMGAVAGVDMTSAAADGATMQSLQPGYDFFNAHADNYVVTASNADSIIRVSDGELWLVPGWEDHLAGLQNRGEVRKDIEFYIPEFGMSGGSNGVAIPRNAAHPAAAALLVHWLTSPEVQSEFNRVFGTAPMNAASDDSAALVSNTQRSRSTAWPSDELRKPVEEKFIETVILER
ncbi:extracellular solute-binding protein [Pseudohoeflea coraliihabitans]|uniref:Extracellular solute-binding protein n=1 Tax=Pseudohoeflea coraliihabitans TaxID=2860393 RepID=A0ABS6WSA9_9HYPH|nr:extracellular solute-binding protein [Pseudohoeflea sp. DP4N28-3]MBW3097949.1 extracellular solute-binding protein [Pseudohoeflea sp. DP4N28-3]